MSIRKICVCSTQIPFISGGSEIFYENLITHLRQRSYEVDLVRLPLQPYPHEEIVKCCLAWRLLNLERMEEGSIDLVIGTRFPSYMIPHPNKIVWLQHQHRQIYDLYGTKFTSFTDSPEDCAIRHEIMDLDTMAFGEAKKIFSQSRTVADRLKRFSSFDSMVLYPPIEDASDFYEAEPDNYVLSVSRLAGNKRVHLLVEAMQKLPQFRAVIVGEGYDRANLEATAERLGISDRVQFTGRISRKDVIDYYAHAGAVFYGPFDEDYGYATLEAFYARKPVIACNDSGGVLEFVDSDTGWIAEPDPQSVAACVQDALSRPAEAKQRGNAGFQRIAFITWDYVLDHLLA